LFRLDKAQQEKSEESSVTSKDQKTSQEDEKSKDETSKSESKKFSKRQKRIARRINIAVLKQLVKRPDLVEIHDTCAADPFFLLHLKSYRNTVPVPRHWSQKRKYLQVRYDQFTHSLTHFISLSLSLSLSLPSRNQKQLFFKHFL
jgi:splicing factor 3B subunit 2